MSTDLNTRAEASTPRSGIFDPEHRTLTLGILLGITLVAFEALAVVTIAPRLAAELGGTHLYGWIFSGLLLTSLFGTVLGGQTADRRGPGLVILLGLVVFGLGLVVGAAAPNMPVLILGRLLQGLGGGALVTALFAVVNLAYSDRLRPALFAAMSSAWVVPGLVGPLLAGLVAEAVGWRAVFWGLLPLLVVVAALTVPAFRRFPKPNTPKKPSRLPQAFGLSLGTGLFLAGLTLASGWGALLTVVGGPLALWSLRRLVPAGTLRARPGLPAVVASRGLFYAAFAGVEAFLAFMLTRIHGYSEAVTGVAIATGALSWALGSFVQSRLEKRGAGEYERARDQIQSGAQDRVQSQTQAQARRRAQRIRLGTLLMSVGLSAQLLALFVPRYSLAVSVLAWATAGLGIGLAHSTTSVLAFSYAPEGEGGAVSASLQLADQFSSALSTGVGGALLALATRLDLSERTGVAWAYLLFGLLIVVAVWTAGRGGSAVGGSAAITAATTPARR